VIRPVNIQNSDIAHRLHELQLAAYQVESQLIGYPQLPPLRETVEALQRAGEQFLVWQEEEQFRGAVGYIQAGSTLEICRLVVSPTHFRRGIAARLLEAVETINPSIRQVTVSTTAKNLPAVTLYEKHGYRITQRTVLDDGLVRVELQKQVNP
jgi:ribosomal protein S18 acetylase RimI-like enzyme